VKCRYNPRNQRIESITGAGTTSFNYNGATPWDLTSIQQNAITATFKTYDFGNFETIISGKDINPPVTENIRLGKKT